MTVRSYLFIYPCAAQANKKKTGGAHASCTTTFSVIQSVKELSLNARQGFNPESGCKGKNFTDTNQIILRKNSKNNDNFMSN
jgi:hypothetical protein